MNKVVFASEATIATATVEVKTVTIGKRQMTLSLFRQVPDGDIINPLNGELRGSPWGIVEYHWKDCGDYKDHVHVLWQKENELRRSVVHENPLDTHRLIPQFADGGVGLDHITIRIAIAAIVLCDGWESDRLVHGSYGRFGVKCSDFQLAEIGFSDGEKSTWALEKALSDKFGRVDPDQALAWADGEIQEHVIAVKNYRIAADKLRQLDQLYLAG